MVTPQEAHHTPHNSLASVMVSYSRTDSAFVDQLQHDLEVQGSPTWVDRRDIDLGTQWDDEIRGAIDGAHVVLVVLTPAAAASKWVRKEWTYAQRRHKVVIPLLYLPCDIPSRLARLEAVDFRPNSFSTKASYAQQLSRLTNSIKGYAPLDTEMPIPLPRQDSRAVPILLGIMMVLGVGVVGVAGYSHSALLPHFLQPYARLLAFLGAALSVGSGGVLIVHLLYRRAGVVSLYRKDRVRFHTKVTTRYMNRLKPPFEGALLLTLGLSEDAQALAHPALARQDSLDTQPRPLPEGTTISAMFQEAEGQLLILGAPGTGKSTLLYQLAQNLMGRARSDDAIPIPVVFNLASWAQHGKSLEDWMVDQLVETWQVPLRIARVWVHYREVLPLLDGLDEVRKEARDACVEAINHYHHMHGLDPIAVCSRVADYYAQNARLDLQKAVITQPLTEVQIDAYLASGRQQLVALRDLILDDGDIRDLLSTPLLLSIVSLAYANRLSGSIPRPSASWEDWTQVVFHDYVQRMLARRGPYSIRTRQVNYAVAETTRYLAWLAVQMQAHGQTDMFYLERLQPSWLPDNRARRDWRRHMGLAIGLVLGPFLGLGFGLGLGPVGGLGVGLVGGLAGALVGGLGHEEISLAASVRFSWPTWHRLRAGLGVGVVVGVISGLMGGLGFGLVGGLGFGLGFGLVIAVVVTLVVGLGSGLVIGLGFGVIVALVSPLVSIESVDEHDLSGPGDGVTQSLHAGLVGGLGFGLVGGLVVGLIVGLMGGVGPGLGVGLIIAMSFGVALGQACGWDAYMEYRFLMHSLFRLHLIPPHFVNFLDFAADHVLLQRVGGGYRFVHALVLDYFAAQWPELSSTRPKKES